MDSDQEDVCDGGLLNCPKCSMPFKHKRSLAHHIDYRCKADKLNNILTETRRPSKIPATEIRVDSEADYLLDTVEKVQTIVDVHCHSAINHSTFLAAIVAL